MKKILYATKAWKDFPEVVARHPKAGMLILNNADIQIIDLGKTDNPYYLPELEAIRQADTEYILWYAGDVVPPEQDWTKEAIKLLKDYPIVSPFWEYNYADYVRSAEREKEKTAFHETDFGFEDYCFSDQAYIAKVTTMRSIDYNIDHPIKELYPPHGDNSFERRVGQWLAHTKQKRAVLKEYRYRHITKAEKI